MTDGIKTPPLNPFTDLKALLGQLRYQQQISEAAQSGSLFSPLTAEEGALPQVGDRAARPGQTLYNLDGTTSSEKTRGFGINGVETNIPTVVPGPDGVLEQRSVQEALDMFFRGENPAVGEFRTAKEASVAAKARSLQGGRNVGINK